MGLGIALTGLSKFPSNFGVCGIALIAPQEEHLRGREPIHGLIVPRKKTKLWIK
jgi:hypothetical protein